MDDILGILPTLTKDYILSKITQEQIFERYFGVKVETGYLLKSPSIIRTDDDDPSFSFYYSSNGKLRGRDFAGYFWGDCFDCVAFALRLNIKEKATFAIILDRIARDFKVHKYEGKNYIETGNTVDNREAIKVRTKTVIHFQPREWNKIDADFWWAGNINRKLLALGRVYPCNYVFVNSQLIYSFVPKDPAYAYYFTPEDIRVYFPFRDSYRFVGNTSYLQGIDLLQPDRIGIVTKSYKDVLTLRSFEVQSIAPTSETVPLTKEQWWKAKNTCQHWFSLMDFDRTGILMARKLRHMYGIRPLFFANFSPLNKKLKNKSAEFYGLKLANNFKNYPTVKDFYDYVRAFGKDKTIELINSVKDIYEEEFDKFDVELYENLKWIKQLEKPNPIYGN